MAGQIAICITARSGVSTSLSQHVLKTIRPLTMLPTLQIIEMYVIICSTEGSLTGPVLSVSDQARNPTFVDRSTVAYERTHESKDAGMRQGGTRDTSKLESRML